MNPTRVWRVITSYVRIFTGNSDDLIDYSFNFRTNVVSESEVDQKWTRFAERPDDSALAPLDNVYHTSFGGIRWGEQYISATVTQ